VFDAVLVAALDIIDRNRVVHVVASPSGRSYYQVSCSALSLSLSLLLLAAHILSIDVYS
jgi:hypothetical protein